MFTRRNLAIAIAIVAIVIVAAILYRGCEKKVPPAVEERGKTKPEPTVTVTMDPADGSTVPEIGQLKFNFSIPTKTDKIVVEIIGPEKKKVKGTRVGFEEQSLTWTLEKTLLIAGDYAVVLKKIETKEGQKCPDVSFNFKIGKEPEKPPTTPGTLDLSNDETFRQEVNKALKGQ